ncbi:MAG: transglutaminase-like domain-containing protein [Candidatus Margulisiibacteriota bacterium]
MTVNQIDQSQSVNDTSMQDQIAGAGADSSYLQSDSTTVSESNGTDSVQLSGLTFRSTVLNSVLAKSTRADREGENYIENNSQYYKLVHEGRSFANKDNSRIITDALKKLQGGSSKIDGSNPAVKALVDNILKQAGLSEKPAGMSDAEYEQAVAETICSWLSDNWDYIADAGGDYWQSVAESLGLSGDCEDFAILLASMLIAAGIDSSNVAVIVNADGDHASVAVEIGGKVYILDNGSFEETNYSSLGALCADGSKVGAWFTQDSQGINNEDLEIDTANDTSGASNAGDAVGALSSTEQSTLESVLDFDDDDYMFQNSNGYWEPDTDALLAWQMKVLKKANIMAALLIAMSSPAECRQILEETFSETPIEEGSNNYKEAYSRKIAFLQKLVNAAISKLFQQINAKNREIYESRQEDIKETNEGTGASTENFFCGGSQEIETAEDSLKETVKYMETTKRTLAAMQEMVQAMIDFLKDGMASDDFGTMGIINALKKFNEKLDKMNEKVDEGLQDALDKLEDLPDPTVLGAIGCISALLGNWGYLIIKAIVDNCSDHNELIDGSEYMEDVDIEHLITEYRGSIMAMQNAQRAGLSVKLFKTDLFNTTRQEFTGLTGIGNNAEMVMRSTETVMGLTLSVFDTTASQMMLKTQLHNTAVKTLDGIQQLRKAQSIRLISLACSALILALAIVLAIVSWGTLSFLIIAACAAALAIVKAVADAYAIEIATDLEGYEPAEPGYEPRGNGKSSGETVLDVLNNAEAEMENNMANSSNSNSVLSQSDDEYYYFDSIKFSMYEAKQKMLDNAIRCIFSMLKNGRDLRRIVRAEMTGASTVDSGGALMQNAVENIIMQRQMILSAIKFMHSEVVSAKNIAKQRELGKEDAWDGFMWNCIGQIAGAVLGAILGGGAGALLGSSLGGVLASSIYNYIRIAADDYKSMDIDLTSRTELEKMLQKKAGQSIEAKLDQAELAAYQTLLDHGMTGAGDGYFALDVGVVADVYARLALIYSIKEAVAKARSLRSELRAIVKQEFTGISLGKAGELMQTVNSANFRSSMTIASSIVRFMTERVNIKNRARDAEKAENLALGIMIVNIVLAVASYACMAAGAAGNAVAGSLAAVGPALMSFISSLASLIQNWMTADSDLGSYENYQAKTTVDKAGKVANKSQTIDDKLDQLKYQIMAQMNSDLIMELSGSYSAVSADAGKINSAMKGVFNMQEALAVARSIASSARNVVRANFTGKRLSEATFGQESVENMEQVALNILDAMKSALQTICDRRNKMSQATTQAIISGIQSAISLAAVIVSTANAFKQAELKEMDKAGKSDTSNSGVLPQAQNPTAGVADIPAPPAPEATAGSSGEAQNQPGQVTAEARAELADAAPGTTGEGRANERSYSDRVQSRNELQDSVNTLTKVSAFLKLANALVSVVSTLAQGVAYDERDCSEEESSKAGPNSSASSSGSKGKSDIFSSMNSMESDIEDSEFAIADIQNYSAAADQVTMRFEQLMIQMMSLAQEIPQTIQAMHEEKGVGVMSDNNIGSHIQRIARDGQTNLAVSEIMGGSPAQADIAIEALENMDSNIVEMGQARDVLVALEAATADQPEMAEVHEHAGAAAAAMNQQIDAAQQAETPNITQPENTSPSTRALLDLADHIEQMDNQLDQANRDVQQVMEQAEGLQPQVEQITDEEVQQASATQHASGQETVEDPRELLQRLQRQIESSRAEYDQLVGQRNALDQQITDARRLNTAIMEGAEVEVRQMLGNESTTEASREGLLAAAQEQLDGQVTALERQMEQVTGRMTQLRGEISNMQRDVTKLQRDVATIEQARTAAADADADAAAQGGHAAIDTPAQGGGGLFGAVGRWLRGGSLEASEDDAVSHAGGARQPAAAQDTDAVLLVASAGNNSPKDQYDRREREDQVFARYLEEDANRIVGAGVSTGA